jgi:hypothetical protein
VGNALGKSHQHTRQQTRLIDETGARDIDLRLQAVRNGPRPPSWHDKTKRTERNDINWLWLESLV